MIWLYFFLEMCIYLLYFLFVFRHPYEPNVTVRFENCLEFYFIFCYKIPRFLYIFFCAPILCDPCETIPTFLTGWLDCIITTTCQLSPRLHFGKVTRGWHVVDTCQQNEEIMNVLSIEIFNLIELSWRLVPFSAATCAYWRPSSADSNKKSCSTL
jgi:hypothetical protein